MPSAPMWCSSPSRRAESRRPAATAPALSLTGGIREPQEMLDFCAKHGIVSDIELIPIRTINGASERMLKGDVKDRFVIDLATLDS